MKYPYLKSQWIFFFLRRCFLSSITAKTFSWSDCMSNMADVCLPFASTWVHPRFCGGVRVAHLSIFCVILLYVFTFLVSYCNVRTDFSITTLLGSCFSPVVCMRTHVLFTLFVFVCVVVSNTYCVFVLFFIVLFVLCCQFLWIVLVDCSSVFSNVYVKIGLLHTSNILVYKSEVKLWVPHPYCRTYCLIAELFHTSIHNSDTCIVSLHIICVQKNTFVNYLWTFSFVNCRLHGCCLQRQVQTHVIKCLTTFLSCQSKPLTLYVRYQDNILLWDHKKAINQSMTVHCIKQKCIQLILLTAHLQDKSWYKCKTYLVIARRDL